MMLKISRMCHAIKKKQSQLLGSMHMRCLEEKNSSVTRHAPLNKHIA